MSTISQSPAVGRKFLNLFPNQKKENLFTLQEPIPPSSKQANSNTSVASETDHRVKSAATSDRSLEKTFHHMFDFGGL